MKQLAIPALKLSLICAVAALLLATINSYTEPVVTINKQIKLEQSLQAVLPGGQGDLTIGEMTKTPGDPVVDGYYPVTDSTGNLFGYIVVLTGIGYGGELKIVAGYGENGEILNAQIIQSLETPGLGKEAEKPGYMDMFVGKGADAPVPVSKKMLAQPQADALAGVTVTFVGVSAALEVGNRFVKSL